MILYSFGYLKTLETSLAFVIKASSKVRNLSLSHNKTPLEHSLAWNCIFLKAPHNHYTLEMFLNWQNEMTWCVLFAL